MSTLTLEQEYFLAHKTWILAADAYAAGHGSSQEYQDTWRKRAAAWARWSAALQEAQS